MESAYLVSWTDFVEDVLVLRFENVADAEGYSAERLQDDRTAFVATSVDDLGTGLTHSSAIIVKLYNALGPDKPVTKFESRDVGARRTFALLEAKHRNDSVPQPESKMDDQTTTETESEDPAAKKAREAAEAKAAKDAARAEAKATKDAEKAAAKATKDAERAAKAAAKPTAAKPTAAPGGKAAAGQPAKHASEFKPVREGTFRATLLRAMDGTKTVAEIGAANHKENALVLSHAFCLTRDCGIGYDFVDGKIRALFPHGKHLSDAIVVKQPAKAKGESAAASQDEPGDVADDGTAEAA